MKVKNKEKVHMNIKSLARLGATLLLLGGVALAMTCEGSAKNDDFIVSGVSLITSVLMMIVGVLIHCILDSKEGD